MGTEAFYPLGMSQPRYASANEANSQLEGS